MKQRDVATVIDALNRAGVRYLVVGGIAVIHWGYLRYTSDLDLVLELTPENLRTASAALAPLGYTPKIPARLEQLADTALVARWKSEKGMLVFQLWSDRFRDIPIDVFIEEPFPFSAELERSARGEVMQGIGMPVVSYQTLRDLKTSAGRMTDLADLEGLAQVHANLARDDQR